MELWNVHGDKKFLLTVTETILMDKITLTRAVATPKELLFWAVECII